MSKYSFIEGGNIYLRGISLDDAKGNYINWLNDSEVCKYNSHRVFPYNEQLAEEYIKNAMVFKDSLVLAIVEKKKNSHIGNISLQDINFISRSAEFAIILGEKEYWGKGMAKEASVLIMMHGFQELNLHRIYCGTASGNVAMQKLANYLGMTEEGRRREAQFKSGEYNDIIEYGVLRDEFLEKFKN